MTDGGNLWFLTIGATCERSLVLKVRLNWFQILSEWIIIGLEVKVEMDCLNGRLEHNRASRDVCLIDDLSKTIHSGSVV